MEKGFERRATLRLVEGAGHVDTIVRRGEAVFGRAEHERLVEDTDATELDFEFFDSAGEGASLLVEVCNANGSTLED